MCVCSAAPNRRRGRPWKCWRKRMGAQKGGRPTLQPRWRLSGKRSVAKPRSKTQPGSRPETQDVQRVRGGGPQRKTEIILFRNSVRRELKHHRRERKTQTCSLPPFLLPLLGRVFLRDNSPKALPAWESKVDLLSSSHFARVARNASGGRSRAHAGGNLVRENRQRVTTWRETTFRDETLTCFPCLRLWNSEFEFPR